MTIRKITAVHSDGVERYVEYDDEWCMLADAQEILARADPSYESEWARKMRQLRTNGDAT